MLDSRLVGRWRGVVESEAVTMDFASDGSLLYVVHAEGKDQKMFLRFRTEDGVVITDQPSEPREERTRYRIEVDGRLILDFNGDETIFTRVLTPSGGD